MNVILSIRPNFCQAIFNGSKVYEYRKRVFKRTGIDRVYIYATKPICKIVGYFTIDNMIEDSVSHVWNMTHKSSGISKSFYITYFNGRDKAHAIKIKDVIKLDTPIEPKELIKDFTAPQNFMYVDSCLRF
jgi:predicted transcriptional regulator